MSLLQSRLVDRGGGGQVVGDPCGGYRGGLVVQVGGRGDAVVLDGHPSAAVRADALQQCGGLLDLGGDHAMKCTDLRFSPKPLLPEETYPYLKIPTIRTDLLCPLQDPFRCNWPAPASLVARVVRRGTWLTWTRWRGEPR